LIASVLAANLSIWTFRQVVSFPGESRFAYILPIYCAWFGTVVATLLLARIPYSGLVMTLAFASGLGCAFVVTQLSAARLRQRFYIVPAGDCSVMTDVPDVEWTVMSECRLPPAHDEAPIVADLHFDHSDEWERLLAEAAISGRAVYHTRALRESLTGKVEIKHLSENSFGSLLPNLAYRKIKRVTDIGVSALALIVLALPLLAVAAFVRMDSPGPAYFRQWRVGYRGRHFRVVKFRTMYSRQEGGEDSRTAAVTQDNDTRITRAGRWLRKYRIDELPQLINVLRGEMSLIGPRPEAVPLAEWYESELPFYGYRHIVRPGITGWAQVEQGHVAALDDILHKLHFDFFYIKNFSAWLDLLIAMRTVGTVLTGTGSK
jgi:lipopolysaccharide/colanic/teichoic acid biosynthesis glycosyltransferase